MLVIVCIKKNTTYQNNPTKLNLNKNVKTRNTSIIITTFFIQHAILIHYSSQYYMHKPLTFKFLVVVLYSSPYSRRHID